VLGSNNGNNYLTSLPVHEFYQFTSFTSSRVLLVHEFYQFTSLPVYQFTSFTSSRIYQFTSLPVPVYQFQFTNLPSYRPSIGSLDVRQLGTNREAAKSLREMPGCCEFVALQGGRIF
jgi:hypothetical protein